MPFTSRTTALVSCVSQKLSQPAAAQDLYRSPYFRNARGYVEVQGWDWFILSAKHGLVHPTTVIEPYEMSLNAMPAVQRRQWSDRVFAQIRAAVPEPELIQVFAGERYREYLVPQLRQTGYQIEIPLQGLGIGQQLQWFAQQGVFAL